MFGLGVGIVDPVKLFEDARALLLGSRIAATE